MEFLLRSSRRSSSRDTSPAAKSEEKRMFSQARIRSVTVNIAGYQMRLLVWRVVNKALKSRLTFLILLTINFPLTATRRDC